MVINKREDFVTLVTKFSFYLYKRRLLFCFIIIYPCEFTDFIAKFAPIINHPLL
jgi:hypothetical protein